MACVDLCRILCSRSCMKAPSSRTEPQNSISPGTHSSRAKGCADEIS
jgi:hypothetical protein